MTFNPALIPVLAALSGQANVEGDTGNTSAARELKIAQALEYAGSDGVEPSDPLPPGEPPMPPQAETQADAGTNADDALLEGRRRPGAERILPERVRQENAGAVRAPPPEAFPGDPDFPVPDRWRLSETLGLAPKERFFDPYNQNTYKGDRPLCIASEEESERRAKAGLPKCRTPRFLGLKSEDWFLVLGATSDTVIESRSFPIPVGVQTTGNPGSVDVFGRSHSAVFAQTFIFSASLLKGSTAFKPPEIEYRIALAVQGNHVNVPERRVLFVEPSKPSHRTDHFLGVQEAFIDYHIRNVSDR